MLRRPTLRDEDGFSLIELMLVLFILGVVGTVIANGLVQAFRANDEAQVRVEAYEDMQIAMERMSRNVRAASTPLQSVDPDGEGLDFEVLRDGAGGCSRFSYWVDADDALRVAEERSTDGCTTFDAPAERILVPRLADRAVFSFAGYNADEDLITLDPVDASNIDDVDVVTITLESDLIGGKTGTVETVVGLRNAP